MSNPNSSYRSELVEATEEQTEKLDAIAVALGQIAEHLRRMAPPREPSEAGEAEGSHDEYLARAEEIRQKYGWAE